MTKTTNKAAARSPRRMARPAHATATDTQSEQDEAPGAADSGPADELSPPAAAPLEGAGHFAPPSPAPTAKAALVLGLLQREQGATLAELVEATGWQPHTRAMLTGLRKKGHALAKTKRNEATCYHVAQGAA